MNKLKYFPFGQEFDLRMGTSVFKEDESLVEVDDKHYLPEIALKRNLLETDHGYYYRSNAGTEPAQWDVVEKVLTDLVRFKPEYFSLSQNGNDWFWQNNKTKESLNFVFGKKETLPFEPLDWVGRQVQEDLVILSNDGTASIVAGQLCFPNGWCLDDKFNQPFLTIHAPAPKMVEPTMQTAQKLMEKIIATRPVWRCSWNFKTSGQIDLSSKYTKQYNEELLQIFPTLTPENIGSKIFIRIERQTISRLPKSNCILFGIHMYQNTLDDEDLDTLQSRNMLNVLKTTPRAMLDYKAITPFIDALLGYLENRL
jgi:dimethylamine monooxygenase subunit A